MNHLLSKIISLCLLVISLSISANPVGKGKISGRILDKQHNPFYPGTVKIDGLSISGFTDEAGIYHIKDIPEGNHTIVVLYLGKETYRKVIHVAAGKMTQIDDIFVNSSFELAEVKVYGKSEARKKQEQAYAISVLDLKKAYHSVAPLNKLLNNVSSVRIREDGGMGSNYNFSLNGFSGSQVKFFLDGIPMDNFGSSFNLTNISTNMVERIEVYKGVLPVSLGADALGGAVNLISRKDANYLDASYSIGSFNTHRAALNGGFTDRTSGFTMRLNAFYNYSDNDYKVFAPIIDLSTNKKLEDRWVKRFHDGYQSGGIKLETGITQKPYADYLLFGMILSRNDNDVQTGATMDAVYGGVKQKSESMIPSIRYKKDDLLVDGLSVSAYGAYSAVNSFNIDTISKRYNWLGESVPSTNSGEGIFTDSKIKNREWLANANVSYMMNDHHSITLNHVFTSMKRRMNDVAHPDDENNNVPQKLTKNVTGLGWQMKYGALNTNVFTKMYDLHSYTYKKEGEFTEDARWEKVKDHKLNYGYGAAVAYFIIPSLQAKVSYEQAYRLPEATEMFGDGLVQKRNPNLKPESSRNLNAGLSFNQWFSDHHLFAEANFIYRNTKDFILKGVSLTNNPTTGYENIGKVLTKGIEAGVRYEYKTLFHAAANFTYQDIIDNLKTVENKDSYVGDDISENITYKERLPNIPYLFGHADIGFQFKNVGFRDSQLAIDYSLNYVHQYYLSFPGLGAKASKKVIPEQLSHDLSIGYTLKNGKYSVMAECTNFTNEKVYDNYRLQKPGRAFNLKFRYFFSK